MDSIIKGHIDRIRASVSEPNKKAVEDYLTHLKANKDPKTTMLYLWALEFLVKFTPKPFEKLDKTDLDAFKAWLQEQPNKKKPSQKLGSTSINDALGFVKYFLVSYLELEHLKKPFKTVITTGRPMRFKAGCEITWKDTMRMVEACNNQRDKTMIQAWREGALRLNTLSLLKVGYLKFENSHCLIEPPESIIKGKEGRKVKPIIVLVKSVPSLRAYVEMLPNKSPDAWLWTTQRKNGGHLKRSGITSIIKKAAEKANLGKKVYPHLARGSKTMELIENGYASEVIKSLLGWSKNSTVISKYYDLSPEKVLEVVQRKEGLIQEVKHSDNEIPQNICPKCRQPQPLEATFCKCGFLLKPELFSQKEAQADLRLKEMEARLALMESMMKGKKN